MPMPLYLVISLPTLLGFSVQNRAARIVFQVPRRHPTSELLHSIHWLPVGKRIIFKLMLYIYKTLNDLSPIYLSDCLTPYVPLREGLRSSLDTTRLIIPRNRRLIGDRSFSVRGPKLWSVTPYHNYHIRLSSTAATFKQNLKPYLYQFYLFICYLGSSYIFCVVYLLYIIIAVLICLFVKRDML